MCKVMRHEINGEVAGVEVMVVTASCLQGEKFGSKLCRHGIGSCMHLHVFALACICKELKHVKP